MGGVLFLYKADLAHSEVSYEFQGHHHDVDVSFVVVDAPRSAPKLPKHPFEEVFVVQTVPMPLRHRAQLRRSRRVFSRHQSSTNA
ncbi:MAG: hypothetical protein AVDCRST_MAG28-1152 [uncultured Rubrobacteraceae bacterium]|uniref:Uncharacterized protein n=1 Tax=uncultured Rubrobacteraceae bacterium TaxID=349277 RepID=A0A6J4QMI1_9ACTN|nr:MAG: hypothetical protein AVDCRST_MAG28-1152 [uncultured Rubrobacteraceae bacterium]